MFAYKFTMVAADRDSRRHKNIAKIINTLLYLVKINILKCIPRDIEIL